MVPLTTKVKRKKQSDGKQEHIWNEKLEEPVEKDLLIWKA